MASGKASPPNKTKSTASAIARSIQWLKVLTKSSSRVFTPVLGFTRPWARLLPMWISERWRILTIFVIRGWSFVVRSFDEPRLSVVI